MFKISDEPGYPQATSDQVHFLDFFTDLGYELADCSGAASVPFYEKFAYEQHGRIIEYGDPSLQPIMIPIIRDEYKSSLSYQVYREADD